jgi:hypothetical protein
MTSVLGISVPTATEVIVATNELKPVTDPKKIACYANAAPFGWVASAIQVQH